MVIERLWHATDGAIGCDPKFVVHPTLPVAIATAGFREMPDGRLVTAHLEELIAPLTSVQLDTTTLRAQLVGHFLQPVRQLRHDHGEDDPNLHLDFYVGFVQDDAAQLAVIKLHHDPADEPGPQWIDGPGHVGDCLRQNGMLRAHYIYGEPKWNLEQVVERLVHIVRSGIECDAHSGLPHRYAGGTVDVLIVRAPNVEHREV